MSILAIFQQSVSDYHLWNDINRQIHNPYSFKSIEYYLYLKNWIDTVQWHLEDIIRSPFIRSNEALRFKRRIDKSNQERTDLVELIDNYFFEQYKDIPMSANATINTESPAWAIDRLSILILKIFHMQKETTRKEADKIHHNKAVNKLNILIEQKADLTFAIDQLLDDIQQGKKCMKVYKQMKMYNDPSFNPILYEKH